jgi:hypothetical protein
VPVRSSVHGEDAGEDAEAPGDQEGTPQGHGHHRNEKADLDTRTVFEDEDQSDCGDQNERYEAADAGAGKERPVRLTDRFTMS